MRPALFVFAETALELIPREISSHPVIREESLKRHKPAEEMLLDSNKHNIPMRELPGQQKRGRPDLLHFSLMVALESLAAKKGVLAKVVAHTQSNQLISFPSTVRLPRNYNRFCGIMEQLLLQGSSDLISVSKTESFESFFDSLLKQGRVEDVVLFNEEGSQTDVEGVRKLISVTARKKAESPVVFVFGCFPHGTLSPKIRSYLLKKKANEVRLGTEQLAVWELVGLAAHLYELEAGL